MAAGNNFDDFTSFPRVIEGALDASQCGMDSWEGFPEVEGTVRLNDNEFTNFAGAPKKVGGDLSVIGNFISDLSDMPTDIRGSVALLGNSLMFEGDGASQFPKGLKVGGTIKISRRQMTTDVGEIGQFTKEMKQRGLELEIV